MGVMWTAIGLDWKLDGRGEPPSATGSVSNGAIYCLHDGREISDRTE